MKKKEIEIRKKLDEVRNFVIESIIKGNYEVLEIFEHGVDVKILDRRIKLWTNNGEESFSTWSDSEIFLRFETEEASKRMECFNSIIKEVNAEQIKVKKQKLESLKKELGL